MDSCRIVSAQGTLANENLLTLNTRWIIVLDEPLFQLTILFVDCIRRLPDTAAPFSLPYLEARSCDISLLMFLRIAEEC